MRFFLIIFILPLLNCVGVEPNETKNVLPGAYQFNNYYSLLEGKSVGIVANKASEIKGVHLVDTLIKKGLYEKSEIHIKTIFSPEHGFSGMFDAGKIIENEEVLYDSIPIISLYGKNKKPDASNLEGIDIMLFDLQDVGVRFYTYISTLHYVMQACAESNIPLIVLDRPNPHTHYVDGPILEEGFNSFVGMHQVPIVYGMTIGEYAQMINGEGWLGGRLKCDLRIIEISNFMRNSVYDLPSKPSPNLPNMQSVLLYPSLCLFEGTVMSVGRGTDFPFQVIGHPKFPNLSFSFIPVSTPGASLHPKFEDEICFGTDLTVLSLDSLRGISELNISYLLSYYKDMQLVDSFFTDYFTLLAGTEDLQKQIIAGWSEKKIRASWMPGLNGFIKIREKYLIYK